MTQHYVCANCGKVVSTGSGQDYHGTVLCQDCYDAHFQECECCGTTYDHDWDTEHEGAWGGMCGPCSDEHFECDCCGDVLSNNDYGEDGLCRDCYDRQHSGLHAYHDGATCGIVYHPNDHEPLYFGVELETDNYDARSEAATALQDLSKDEDLFWLENDSSLCNGIEIITQPCTLEYHRDTFPWAEIAKMVERHGGKSHDTQTCGLHVHFSKQFFDGIHSELYQLRLVYIFEKLWDKFAQFSRRDIDNLNHFARKYNTKLLDKPAKRKIRDLRRGWVAHYQCVNLGNGKTIEIRLFRGSLRVETILASIELVDFLVRLVKKTSTRKLQSMTWQELTAQTHKNGQYRYLPDYLKLRELSDTTTEKEN